MNDLDRWELVEMVEKREETIEAQKTEIDRLSQELKKAKASKFPGREYIVWKNQFSQKDIHIGMTGREGVGIPVLIATLYEDCFLWLFGLDVIEAIPNTGNVRMKFEAQLVRN